MGIQDVIAFGAVLSNINCLIIYVPLYLQLFHREFDQYRVLKKVERNPNHLYCYVFRKASEIVCT